MGKLFVTVFAPPGAGFRLRRLAEPQLLLLRTRQICNCRCTRTPTTARNQIPATMTNSFLQDNLFRDTAPMHVYQISAPGVIPVHLETLYRDRALKQ